MLSLFEDWRGALFPFFSLSRKYSNLYHFYFFLKTPNDKHEKEKINKIKVKLLLLTFFFAPIWPSFFRTFTFITFFHLEFLLALSLHSKADVGERERDRTSKITVGLGPSHHTAYPVLQCFSFSIVQVIFFSCQVLKLDRV